MEVTNPRSFVDVLVGFQTDTFDLEELHTQCPPNIQSDLLWQGAACRSCLAT